MTNDPFNTAPPEEDFFIIEGLDDVEEKDFTPLPPGDYCLRCIALDMKATSKTRADGKGGDPMWVWTFQVASTDDHNGREVIDRTLIMEKTMWKVRGHVVALGMWKEGSGTFRCTEALAIGKVAKAKIKHRRYMHNGEQKVGHEIDRLTPWTDPVPDDETPF